jgi:DNA-binding XRE family transcriptional regulator
MQYVAGPVLSLPRQSNKFSGYLSSSMETKLPRKQNLSKHLREARIKRGLSVAEVAEQVGVSQTSIYFWETDYCRPRAANLAALCKVLKLPVRATRELAGA